MDPYSHQVDLQGDIQLLDNDSAPQQSISSSQYKQSKKKNISTLDEPVSETIMRDLRMIGYKLKYVLLPRLSEEDQNKNLRNWDLWGPLLLCLCLALTLSISSSGQTESVFAIIFVVVWIGAGVVTLNAKLLGGRISFFQSVCVLGYCVFPINIASFASIFLPSGYTFLFLVKAGLCGVSFLWSTRASVPFMSTLVSEDQKFLAVYPVFLFYLFLSWFTLVA